MTYKCIDGGDGCEPVGESSGTGAPEHAHDDVVGRAGVALGAQFSETEFATAESSQDVLVTTTTQDDKCESARARGDEPDCSVLPTALDSTGDGSHADADIGAGLPGIGSDNYGLLETGSEVPPAQDTSRLEPSTNDTGASLSMDASLGVQSAILSVGIDKPKFFWEVDPFLKTIFGKEPIGSLVMPDVVRPEPAINVETPQDVWTFLRRPKRAKTDAGIASKTLKFVAEKDEIGKRASVLADWASLVCVDIESFNIGRILTSDNAGEVTHALVVETVGACFAMKATATLTKRFYALNRFVNWCFKDNRAPFPLREKDLFHYMQELRDNESTAPSAGRSFLEAVKFTSAILGLDGNVVELGTARLSGVASQLALRAGPILQASPLTVVQVRLLERLLVETEDLKDKVVIGGALVLLYGCGRLSDGQRAVRMICDWDVEKKFDPSSFEEQGFIELQVLNHKTARSEKLKRTFLPLVCPLFSMSGLDWVTQWLMAREAVGLVNDGRFDKPFIPRFDIGGHPLQQEVTASEIGSFLRMALNIPNKHHNEVRGHSLKVTCLSWSGKFGVSLESRRLLGHHLTPDAVSAETYSRDSMGPAVRDLLNVLRMIKQGSFMPDLSRSGRFSKEHGHAELQMSRDSQDEGQDSDSDYKPGESDTSVSSSSDDERPESRLWSIVSPPLRPRSRRTPAGATVYRHVISGIQHLATQASSNENKLVCGRRLNCRYVKYDGSVVADVPLCETCSHRDA